MCEDYPCCGHARGDCPGRYTGLAAEDYLRDPRLLTDPEDPDYLADYYD